MFGQTRINMMVARDYVPEWTAADAFRELVSNAIDADPDFELQFYDDGLVEIITATAPTLTQLMLMGAGTKSVDSESIGQFGEGFKLAALVLTRGSHGLTVQTPAGEVTFYIDVAKHLDVATLHAVVCERNCSAGRCKITFRAADMKGVYAERFLPRDKQRVFGRLEKIGPRRSTCRIYARGVLVKELEDESIYDWNLERVKLNRDRNVPDLWQVRSEIARMIERELKNGDEDLATTVLLNPSSLEHKAFDTIYSYDDVKKLLAAAFLKEHGHMSVLSSDGKHDQIAASRGYKIVHMCGDMESNLHQGGVRKSCEVVSKSDTLHEVLHYPLTYVNEIAEIERLLEIIGITKNVRVFESSDDGPKSCLDDKGLWLEEDLFTDDARYARLRQVMIELGSYDKFTPSDIAAKLAIELLKERTTRHA